ncbi:MAG: hypothetical protein RL653_1008 [Pseudomonadota bacterium]|jgi:predicted metal-dependent peptidase
MAAKAKKPAGGGEQQALDELGRAIISLLMKEPFYGHLLGGVVRSVDAKVGTLGVALTPGGVVLKVAPEFFLGLSRAEHRVAVVKHELLHLLFRHLYRERRLVTDPQLFNLAADLVVNQFVAPWPLPAGAVTLDTFPDLELKPDQALEWYLDRLEKAARGGGGGGGGGKAKGKGKPQRGAGAGGGGGALKQDPSKQGNHGGWAAHGGEGFEEKEGGGGLSGLMRDALEQELERHIVRAKERTGAKGWGSVPQQLREEIDRMVAARKPKVDWRRTLRLFASSGRRTRIVVTNRKESKRFGTFPGIKVKRYQHVLVALDTSGSIGAEVVEAFFAEVHGIHRAGAEVTVVECDAAVQRHYPYTGTVPPEVKGRGGTAFDPVFAWMRAQRGKRFDACIYLTDAEGPTPELKPPCRLLWVVTPGGAFEDAKKWGQAVQLSD